MGNNTPGTEIRTDSVTSEQAHGSETHTESEPAPDMSLMHNLKPRSEMAELLPQIVYELDREGSIVFMNLSGMEALGYSLEEVAAGIPAVQVFVLEDRDKVATKPQSVLIESFCSIGSDVSDEDSGNPV